MSTQHETDLAFIITSKGFDTSSPESLQKALTWLRTTDGDNLMYGEPTGDEFDKMVGEMRRPTLIESLERAIKQMTLSRTDALYRIKHSKEYDNHNEPEYDRPRYLSLYQENVP